MAYDRQLSTLQGVEAVRAVLDATAESPTYMIAIAENKIVRTPLVEAVKATQSVTAAIESKDFQRALAMRGPEVEDYYKAYMTTTATVQPEQFVEPSKVCFYGDVIQVFLTVSRGCESLLSTLVLPQVV